MLATGASPLRPRRLQQDVLFDSPDGHLRRQGCALRIRTDDTTTVLTFKGPVQPGPFKTREEHETLVGDGQALARILHGMGLEPWFRYEKYREEFGIPGVVIAVDETPIGTFVELEGEAQGIARLTAALGRTEADYVRGSYRSLFIEARAASGLNGEDMLFPPR